jgi:hypothetical protein
VKKLIALLVLAAIVFVVWNRQRLFVRDPLASVMRDGAKVSGEQVYINFTNDVLLENDNPPMQVLLVERGRPIGVPSRLHCVHWVGCLTDADAASTLPTGGSIESMNAKSVSFRDSDGHAWVVSLR